MTPRGAGFAATIDHMVSEPSAPGDDFSTLFQFLPIGAYRSVVGRGMVRANPALVALTGLSSEAELLADLNASPQGWYLQPARRAEFLDRLLRDGKVTGFVSEVRPHRGAGRLWVSENAHVVRDAAGEVLYYEGTVEDVTARMAAERAVADHAELLRLVTEQVPGAVYLLHIGRDGQRRYRFVSEGIRDIYGFGPDELLADPWLIARFRHPDDRDRLERDHVAVLGDRTDLAGEFRIVLPDGRTRWVLRRSTRVMADAQGVLRAGVLIDVTERKAAEAALKASEALWKLALEGAGDGVWDWNLQTGEEFFSAGLRAMLGYAQDELPDLAREMDARTHPDDIPQMEADRQAHFCGRVPQYRNEHRVRCRDGQWKWVLSRGVVIARDAAGQPLRMVGTHTDITAFKQAEADRRTLEAQLRESQKMEAIGTLAGGVAHDFNNLLAAILGNLTIAREDVGTDHPAQESLQEIHRAALRARQLVQQILTFSRRQSQAMECQPLQPAVEEALRLLRSLLPAGVKLHADLRAPDLPVLADATQVQQVVINLCTNAWQAFDGAGGEIRVALERVALDAAAAVGFEGLSPGAYLRLSVSDNGRGMDAETRRRIFEPFFTTKAPGTGTGLGLSVVHGIVKAHHAGIAVHSAPGEGTRFEVCWPLAPGEAGAAATASAESPSATAAALAGRHIVYIDDYEALVFLVGRLLRKQGLRVTTFESGEAALAWFGAHPAEAVDLVVTDHNMPGLSGVEVASALRALRPGLRVAVVSGHVNDTLIAEARAAGVSEVLGKQDSMDALGEQIRGLLNGAASA